MHSQPPLTLCLVYCLQLHRLSPISSAGAPVMRHHSHMIQKSMDPSLDPEQSLVQPRDQQKRCWQRCPAGCVTACT